MTTTTITAAELCTGMTVVDGRKRTPVVRIERGASCRGLHLNVLRAPATEKRNGKSVPSPRGGQIVHNDGCYDPAMLVQIEVES